MHMTMDTTKQSTETIKERKKKIIADPTHEIKSYIEKGLELTAYYSCGETRRISSLAELKSFMEKIKCWGFC